MKTSDFEKGCTLMQYCRDRSFMENIKNTDFDIMHRAYEHAINLLKDGYIENREIVELYEYLAPDLLKHAIAYINSMNKLLDDLDDYVGKNST